MWLPPCRCHRDQPLHSPIHRQTMLYMVRSEARGDTIHRSHSLRCGFSTYSSGWKISNHMPIGGEEGDTKRPTAASTDPVSRSSSDACQASKDCRGDVVMPDMVPVSHCSAAVNPNQ